RASPSAPRRWSVAGRGDALMRRLAAAALTAALLVPAGAAAASVVPGGAPATVVTLAPPVLSPHVFCQYEVRGRVVSVGLPLGVKGHGERTVVEEIGRAHV